MATERAAPASRPELWPIPSPPPRIPGYITSRSRTFPFLLPVLPAAKYPRAWGQSPGPQFRPCRRRRRRRPSTTTSGSGTKGEEERVFDRDISSPISLSRNLKELEPDELGMSEQRDRRLLGADRARLPRRRRESSSSSSTPGPRLPLPASGQFGLMGQEDEHKKRKRSKDATDLEEERKRSEKHHSVGKGQYKQKPAQDQHQMKEQCGPVLDSDRWMPDISPRSQHLSSELGDKSAAQATPEEKSIAEQGNRGDEPKAEGANRLACAIQDSSVEDHSSLTLSDCEQLAYKEQRIYSRRLKLPSHLKIK